MNLLKAKDPENERLFSQLQGNILKGHGRNHTTHIFFQFKKDSLKEIKHFFATFSREVTSFKKQLAEAEDYKSNGISGDTFYSISFTASGLEFLNQNIEKFEASFKKGMKNATSLEDAEVKSWELGYSKKIDGKILIADDNKERLGDATRKILERVKAFSSILQIEYGDVIRNANGDGLEHFGYVDGISQPLFLEEDLEAYIINNNTSKDYLKYDPSAEISTVLVNDPLVRDKDAFGSYFVFRKLEQNVRDFKRAEEKIDAKQYRQYEEIAGGFLFGRFEDGTPITLSDKEGLVNSGKFNDFNYSNDPKGSKCPFHSHIRATNDRTTSHKKHIMARRGITYGHRNTPMNVEQTHEQYPTKDVGLLFMSYQSSIENQFEYIQKLANDSKNNGKHLDPIIGQNGGNNKSSFEFPKSYDDSERNTIEFNSYVKLKGGDYFYTPSITFLNKINL